MLTSLSLTLGWILFKIMRLLADNQVLTRNNLKNVVIIFGDSTALGRADFITTHKTNRRRFFRSYEYATVWNYNVLQVQNLEYGVNNAIGAGALQFGLELKLADLMKTNGLAPCLFIKRAVGGTSLNPQSVSGVPSWDKATGTNYNSLISDITNACNSLYNDQYGHQVNIKAIICLLGLNDTLNDTAASDFEARLDELVNNIYDDSPYLEKERTPFLIGRPNSAADVNPTRLATIQGGIDNVAANYSWVKSVNLDGLSLKPSDDLHHNSNAELDDSDSVAHRFFAYI